MRGTRGGSTNASRRFAMDERKSREVQNTMDVLAEIDETFERVEALVEANPDKATRVAEAIRRLEAEITVISAA